MTKKILYMYMTAIFLTAVDQFTKYIVKATMFEGECYNFVGNLIKISYMSMKITGKSNDSYFKKKIGELLNDPDIRLWYGQFRINS